MTAGSRSTPTTSDDHAAGLVPLEDLAASPSPPRSPSRWRQWRALHPVLQRLLPPWLLRRAWLLVLAVLTGTCGGLVYSAAATPSYAAQATLAVPTGATTNSPGSANEADALAITYAAALPGDDARLSPAAAQLGLPLDTLTHHLAVSVESGTSVIVLRYTAPTRAEAVRGVNTIANKMVDQRIRDSVVPRNTLNVVQFATTAQASSIFVKYGPEVGFFLGLLLGIVLMLVAERVDPRADTSSDIEEIFGRPAVVALPSELSVPEFGHALMNTTGPTDAVTLAPLRWWEAPAAHSIEKTLHQTYPDASFVVSTALEEGTAHQLESDRTIVLLVRSGERMQALGDVLERLDLMGNSPTWIALLDRDDLYH